MNDRYLFRAKRIDNCEWVEGVPIQNHIGLFVCFEENPHYCSQYGYMEIDGIVNVDEKTLCQCTGLKKFFEKDIVKRTDIHKVGEPSIGIIEYDVENTAFLIHWIDNEKYSPMYPWKDKIKVIGNIFDNQELLEQEGR